MSMNQAAPKEFTMKATTFFGLEDVLTKELLKLGAKNIEPFKRGVSFTGDAGFMYKANLCLRTAIKVLVPIYSFYANDEHELYNKMKQYEWEKHLDITDTLAINANVNSDNFNHSLYVSQKSKDAICDRFVDLLGKRPNVDTIKPTLRLYIHVFQNQVTINMDSSGDALFKRGYRVDVDDAPMKESLVAGILLLSNWQQHQVLYDAMCGSGTIGIEAAMIANNIPANILRKEFGFMKWKNFDAALWDTIHSAALAKINAIESQIFSNDLNPNTLEIAKKNAAVAKLDDVIQFKHISFFDLMPHKEMGHLVLNPPYNERMKLEDVNAFYKKIGDKLKKDFSGWTCWLITSNTEAIKHIGLHPSKKINLHNGALECKLLKFELYAGSKKVSKSVIS